ncbi:MAG TPA: nuclease-related domain-containing protein [Polyangia bacterium]
MRVIELSNHPAQLRREGDERRRAEAAAAREQYERDVDEHARALAELETQRAEARAKRRWVRWLRMRFAVGSMRRRTPPPPTPPPVDQHREAVITAGIEGEHLVASELAACLNDDWTLIRGYRNRGGEIDGILLGPEGIVAIEIKHWSVTVHVDGEDWWFDRYDRFGNYKETDRDRRSPSEQLAKPTDALCAFLASRDCRPEILRAVLFTHPRSQLGSWNNLPVNIVATTIPAFLEEFAKQQRPTPPTLLAEVEKLIVRDHHHHDRHRGNRRGRRAS